MARLTSMGQLVPVHSASQSPRKLVYPKEDEPQNLNVVSL